MGSGDGSAVIFPNRTNEEKVFAMIIVAKAFVSLSEEMKAMEMGSVIRKYRKEKDMTQEKMAKRLGVTASLPAVEKGFGETI